ncbi:hypothetical protein ZWY2020_050804 [Hordeum vulgare]|nr:hypothetical protein ZWY2020_050804 [Hordeum vulgare]
MNRILRVSHEFRAEGGGPVPALPVPGQPKFHEATHQKKKETCRLPRVGARSGWGSEISKFPRNSWPLPLSPHLVGNCPHPSAPPPPAPTSLPTPPPFQIPHRPSASTPPTQTSAPPAVDACPGPSGRGTSFRGAFRLQGEGVKGMVGKAE